MNIFSNIKLAERDPILGLKEIFISDNRSEKVNLGIGVYLTENGEIPLLSSVFLAEQRILEKKLPRDYLPIDGMQNYNKAVQNLLFQKNSEAIKNNRIVTIQTIGGTGGIRIGADFIKKFQPNAIVAISDPSWENHQAIFEEVGLKVEHYTYYDKKTNSIDFSGLLFSLRSLPEASIVVLHACCHNPTGTDLTTEQWIELIDLCKRKKLIPFLDMAYQGFSSDLETDTFVLKLFLKFNLQFFLSNSFSKSLSLYGERIGALSIVTADQKETINVLSQLKYIVRRNYSSPAIHSSMIVSTILNDPQLYTIWEKELEQMRNRIKSIRSNLAEQLIYLRKDLDFKFINQQSGMFSYLNLSQIHVEKLKNKYGIYITPNGRICIAALNKKNINKVAEALSDIF